MGSIECDLGRLSSPNRFDISVGVLVGYQVQLHSLKMVVVREYENTSASVVLVKPAPRANVNAITIPGIVQSLQFIQVRNNKFSFLFRLGRILTPLSVTQHRCLANFAFNFSASWHVKTFSAPVSAAFKANSGSQK